MMTRCFDMIRRGFWMLAAVVVATTACRLEAAVTWHENLAAAKSASLASHRPVLVIFTAGWSQASDRFVQQTLAAAEVTAVISSCFEPVRLDVDTNGELARQLGVSHLPTACIVDQNDAVLARLDCPESSAEFVSNAARAIHTASQARGAPNPSVPAPPSSAFATTTGRTGSPEPSVAPPLPPTPPAWPAKPVSQPLDQSPATPTQATSSPVGAPVTSGRLSAFSSSAAQPSATGSQAAVVAPQVIEPAPTAPWASSGGSIPQPATAPAKSSALFAGQPVAGQAPTAYPSTAYPSGSVATQGYPSTPYPSNAGQTAASTSAPTTGYQNYPSTAATTYPSTGSAPPSFQSPTPGLPIYSGTAPLVGPPPTKASPPAAATAEPEKKGSNAFVAFFQDPMSVFKKSPTADSAGAIAKPSATATPQPPTPRNPAIASQSVVPAATDVYGSMPVGLEGYCAVTLVEKSVWVEGRPQWGVRHRGRTYLFAGPAEQQAFLAAPHHYAPALSGDDPVLAFDSGRQVPGQRRYGVTYQSRIYLFSSPETRTAFSVAPEKYVNRVLVAESPQTAAGTTVR